MKAFYSGSAMWRGWRLIGSPKKYVGECAGSSSVGRPQKIWIDTVKECLKKKKEGWMSDNQRRIVQKRSELQEFGRGNA